MGDLYIKIKEGEETVERKISVMITEEEIQKRLVELGEELSRDYAGRSIHMICVLKGGVYFMTDLSKHIDQNIPVSLDFMAVSSYGNERESTGIVRILKDLDESLQGKDQQGHCQRSRQQQPHHPVPAHPVCHRQPFHTPGRMSRVFPQAASAPGADLPRFHFPAAFFAIRRQRHVSPLPFRASSARILRLFHYIRKPVLFSSGGSRKPAPCRSRKEPCAF